MTTNYIIRKLTNSDYNKYLVIINEFRNTSFTEEQFTETLQYIEPFSEIWVIEKDEDIIATGTIIYEKKLIFNNGKLAHIEDVCVKEKYRKFGFGKIIVNHLICKAKEQDCYKVTLVCDKSNVGFYEKCCMEIRGVQMSQLTSNL